MDVAPNDLRELRKQALKLGDDYRALVREFSILEAPLLPSWEFWGDTGHKGMTFRAVYHN